MLVEPHSLKAILELASLQFLRVRDIDICGCDEELALLQSETLTWLDIANTSGSIAFLNMVLAVAAPNAFITIRIRRSDDPEVEAYSPFNAHAHELSLAAREGLETIAGLKLETLGPPLLHYPIGSIVHEIVQECRFYTIRVFHGVTVEGMALFGRGSIFGEGEFDQRWVDDDY